MIKFITYRINGFHNNHTPIAVNCENLSEQKTYEIFFDADSLVGLGNPRINKTGRLRKDRIIITPEKHYKYDWKELEKHYKYEKQNNKSKKEI